MRAHGIAVLMALWLTACGTAPAADGTAADATTPAEEGTQEMFFKKAPGLLKPGEQAPDFALSDQDGRTVRLSDYRGRRLLLWFYPKAATPG